MSWSHETSITVQAFHINMCPTNHRLIFQFLYPRKGIEKFRTVALRSVAQLVRESFIKSPQNVPKSVVSYL